MTTLPHHEVKDQALALAHTAVSQNAAAFRSKALAELEQHVFPHRRLESWKYTNVVKLQQLGFLKQTAQLVTDAAVSEAIFKHRLVFVNGELNEKASTELPAGVKLVRLNNTDILPHAELEQEFTAPFGALNSATFTDGIHLVVANNTQVTEPIELLFFATSEQAAYCNTRVHVSLGAESSLTLLERYEGESPVLTNAITTIVGEKQSKLVHYRLQAEGENSAHISNLVLAPGEESDFRSYQLMQGNVLRRNDVRTIINHENTNVMMKGVFVGRNATHTDNQVTMEHRVPNSTSNMVYKGMAGDTATLVFNGSIHIHPGAFQTVADLTNNNLLLNRGATVNTKPELIIFNDDVICSHGTTCGELEDDAIFFLRSRGLSEEEAEKMLSLAFINEVLLEMSDEAVAEWARPWLNGLLAKQEVTA